MAVTYDLDLLGQQLVPDGPETALPDNDLYNVGQIVWGWSCAARLDQVERWLNWLQQGYREARWFNRPVHHQLRAASFLAASWVVLSNQNARSLAKTAADIAMRLLDLGTNEWAMWRAGWNSPPVWWSDKVERLRTAARLLHRVVPHWHPVNAYMHLANGILLAPSRLGGQSIYPAVRPGFIERYGPVDLAHFSEAMLSDAIEHAFRAGLWQPRPLEAWRNFQEHVFPAAHTRPREYVLTADGFYEDGEGRFALPLPGWWLLADNVIRYRLREMMEAAESGRLEPRDWLGYGNVAAVALAGERKLAEEIGVI